MHVQAHTRSNSRLGGAETGNKGHRSQLLEQRDVSEPESRAQITQQQEQLVNRRPRTTIRRMHQGCSILCASLLPAIATIR